MSFNNEFNPNFQFSIFKQHKIKSPLDVSLCLVNSDISSSVLCIKHLKIMASDIW